MKLYIMRHGETDWNRLNRVLGRTDIPLNDTGIAQARTAAEALADTPLDAIYTSCFSRTIDTAEIIRNLQKRDVPIAPVEALNEHDFGIFEGVDRADETYQREKRNFAKRYPGGESYLDVAARVYPFLDSLRGTGYERVLLVTHGGICRIIVNRFSQMDDESFARFTMRNCEVREFEL